MSHGAGIYCLVHFLVFLFTFETLRNGQKGKKSRPIVSVKLG